MFPTQYLYWEIYGHFSFCSFFLIEKNNSVLENFR